MSGPKEVQVSPTSIPPLEPEVDLPADDRLPGLPELFDGDWVWRTFCKNFGQPEESPQRIRALQFTYRPGARALVSYAAEWQQGRWLLDDQFAIELAPGKPNRVYRYPDDPHLPGLRVAGQADSAHDLLTKHLGVSPWRVRVEPVRYRPGSRAVFRHIAVFRPARLGSVTFYVRVMRPRRLDRLLTAADIASSAGFRVPPFLGVWPEGGVVWMSEVPGETVREMIRKGRAPRPQELLDALAGLWDLHLETGQGHPLDLLGGFQMTECLLSQLLEDGKPRRLLEQVTAVLRPFARAWQPSGIAHNDFYDDQMLVTPEGKLALVDFEEIGPGDPLVDAANMLAHLRWMAKFGNAREACKAYRLEFRSAALAYFGCDGGELDIREAYAIFRLSAGPFRQLRRNWAKRTTAVYVVKTSGTKGEPLKRATWTLTGSGSSQICQPPFG